MLLRSTSPADGITEKKVLDWLVDNFGQEDARVLTQWVWERERAPDRYLAVLLHLVEETRKAGRSKSFIQNLIDHARKPREQAEAEEQLMQAMLPSIEKSKVKILGHRNDPKVVEEELETLRSRLRENIRLMWPAKHRATVDGAIMCGSRINGGSVILDYRAIAEALVRHDDALKATASSSHG